MDAAMTIQGKIEGAIADLLAQLSRNALTTEREDKANRLISESIRNLAIALKSLTS